MDSRQFSFRQRVWSALPVAWYLALVWLTIPSTLFTQNQHGIQRFTLNVDYSRFWKNDSTVFVEISTGIYPRLVTLAHDSAGIHGKVEVSIQIERDSTHFIAFNNKFIDALEYHDSVEFARTKSIVNKTTYELAEGCYRIHIVSRDMLDPSRTDSLITPIEVQRRAPGIQMSDIELCSEITPSTDHTDVFYKNGFRVIPNPSCMFGSTASGIAFMYFELYNLSADVPYDIKTRLTDSNGKLCKTLQRTKRGNARNIVDIETFNTTSLASGKYSLEVTVLDTLGEALATGRKSMFLFNPHLHQQEMAVGPSEIPEYQGLSLSDLREEFKKMQYLVSKDHISIFASLTTPEACKKYLEELWYNIEHHVDYQGTMTRAIHQDRVAIATDRFGTNFKVGWKTDRGRVFLHYGEPDEVQRFPYNQENKAYEIWSYHQVEGGVEFIFIDINNFNDYTLVHSTKSNEVRNEMWQQLLLRSRQND